MLTSMKLNTYDAVPEWARFLTLDELHAFLAAIERDLIRRRLVFEDRDGLLHVVMPDGRTARCGLANVALKCGAAGRDGYDREVAAHFDRVLAESGDPPPFPERFEEMQSLMRARVYTDAYIAASKAKVVSRRLAEGLQAVAVYHLPQGAAAISAEHLAQWKVSPEEALEIAIANSGREKLMREAFELDAGDAFALLDTAGYAASQVLHLEKYLGPSEHGALVALPCRYVLICYPIVAANVLEALRELVPRVDDIHDAPPGGEDGKLVSDLFWWRKGKMMSMRAGMNLAGLEGSVIAPPQEFMDTVFAKAAGQAKKGAKKGPGRKR